MSRRLCLLTLAMLASVVSDAGAQGAADTTRPQAWTLEDVVTAALAQHPLVEAARARLDAARSERDAMRALANPIGTFWMENDAPRETSFYLTYPFESMLQRAPRVRRAEEDLRAANASLTLARRLVVADTVRTFFGVALAQVLYEEAQENHDRLEQLVSYNRARVGEGVTAEGELLRLDVELSRAVNEVVLAEVEFTRSRAQLSRISASARAEGSPRSAQLFPRHRSSRWLEERWPAWAATIHRRMKRRPARRLGEAHV